MPPVSPYCADVANGLQPARCYADWADNGGALDGWILLPDRPLDHTLVLREGDVIGRADLHAFEPARERYSRIPHAERSGFRANLGTPIKADEIANLSFIGVDRNRPVARRDIAMFADARCPAAPTPPESLIDRAQGGADVDLYKRLGFRYYQQIRRTIARHRRVDSVRRLLDLGCGSGRVLANFVVDAPGIEVTGCDIDGEAIHWCRDAWPRCRFDRIEPYPPLPYAKASFDIVVSLAVFAAFGPEEQALWLPELQRVVSPGGLLLISVQGMFSASFLHPPPFLSLLARRGMIAQKQYETLRGEMGLGEYLGVYQTRSYTWREWSTYFEVLEHLEGEINADQDLVVLRRRHS
jgi:SAM-dependent methyltransferase